MSQQQQTDGGGVSCSPSTEVPSSSSIPSPISSCCKIITASERKIKEAESRLQSCSSDIIGNTDGDTYDLGGNQHGYVLMDTEILSSLLVELVKCPRCGFYVHTEHLVNSKTRVVKFIQDIMW